MFELLTRKRRNPSQRQSGLRHLGQFTVILSATTIIKFAAIHIGIIVPPLAAWEMAALVHVYVVAENIMQSRGFHFATKAFNMRVRRWVLRVLILFMLLKIVIIVFEAETYVDGKLVRLIGLWEKIRLVEGVIHSTAPYILIMPLFFFFMVNHVARRHVASQARRLGIENTDQEQYLIGLMWYVDAPVLLPFMVMVSYFRIVDRIFEPGVEDLVVGVIGCSLLIVSNLLSGVFDEQWSQMSHSRRRGRTLG